MSARTQDEIDRGAHGAWSSNALTWAATARRLVSAPVQWTDVLVGFIAMHLVVKNARLLVTGRQPIRSDRDRVADSPYTSDEFEQLERLYADIRNAILHHADRTTEEDGGYAVEMEPGSIRIQVTRGKGKGSNRVATVRSVLDTLDILEPWLRRTWERATA